MPGERLTANDRKDADYRRHDRGDSSDDDGDAYSGTTVESVREGWWYTTPLPGGRRVVAYLTDEDLWRKGARDWHALLAETRHIAGCAGKSAMSAEPRPFPADTARARQYDGDGWLAVGDAAAAFETGGHSR